MNQQLPISPSPAALGNDSQRSVSMHLTTLDTSGKYSILLCDWLMSLSIMSSKFTYVVVCDRISIFFKAE